MVVDNDTTAARIVALLNRDRCGVLLVLPQAVTRKLRAVQWQQMAFQRALRAQALTLCTMTCLAQTAWHSQPGLISVPWAHAPAIGEQS